MSNNSVVSYLFDIQKLIDYVSEFNIEENPENRPADLRNNFHHFHLYAYYHAIPCEDSKKMLINRLGDAVLELVVSDYLYNNYHLVEGEMTKTRANYVCEKALSTYALELKLQEYIKLGNGELKTGGLEKPTILADIFEALMGAIYLDLGFEVVKKIIVNIIKPYIDKQTNFLEDYKFSLDFEYSIPADDKKSSQDE